MADGPTDPRWPHLLSLSAHELRSPLSVVAGYIRMLLKDRAGPLSDQQRHLLEEAEKSCGRMSALVAEMSELSQLESGNAPSNRGVVNLPAILGDAIAALSDLPDRSVTITLVADHAITLEGDPVRLRTAFSSILRALRRELVDGDQLVVHVDVRAGDATPSIQTTIGEPTRIDALRELPASGLTPFDEWRGGNGLSLPNARRMIEAHGGRLSSPLEDGKSSAIIIFPG